MGGEKEQEGKGADGKRREARHKAWTLHGMGQGRPRQTFALVAMQGTPCHGRDPPQKKRKGFDVAAYIKRKIGKARREVRIIIYFLIQLIDKATTIPILNQVALLQHQAHYVCMLAHLRHIDHVLNKPILKVK